MKHYQKLLFFGILTVALFVRLFNLSSYPPSLNWDEVSLGYNANSILQTGKDEWGVTLPLSFRAYGDYKLPGYIYFDLPFIAIFGLNEYGVRLLSVLAGVGVVITVYYLTNLLTQDKKLALLGMGATALIPWLIIMSRIGLEANLSLFFISLSVLFFLKGVDRPKNLVTASLLLGLALFTYNSIRVLALPLVALGILIFFKKLILKKLPTLISLLIVILLIVIVTPIAVLQDSSARYHWTKILDEGSILRINESRRVSTLSPMLNRLVNNKVTFLASEVAKNYFSHFDPNFLFINGSSNYQYSVPGSGLVLWSFLPLLFLGIWSVVKNKEPEWLFILGWLLIAPLPAAITKDAPHALRSLTMVIPIMLLSVRGIEPVYKKTTMKTANLIVIGLVVVTLLEFGRFWLNYTTNYVNKYSWSWQYGYQQAVDFVSQEAGKYDRVVFTKKYGEPHEFVLFYTRYNPSRYLNNPTLIRYQRSNWYWVDRLDKYQFINDWEIRDQTALMKKTLLVTSPGNYPRNGKLLKTISFLDGTSAFEVVELN